MGCELLDLRGRPLRATTIPPSLSLPHIELRRSGPRVRARKRRFVAGGTRGVSWAAAKARIRAGCGQRGAPQTDSMHATILPPPPFRASLIESLKPGERGGGEFDLITTRSGFQGL
jgi:hypothetical protein